jgi:hypothetical protein
VRIVVRRASPLPTPRAAAQRREIAVAIAVEFLCFGEKVGVVPRVKIVTS